jgi:hypothetical protein
MRPSPAFQESPIVLKFWTSDGKPEVTSFHKLRSRFSTSKTGLCSVASMYAQATHFLYRAVNALRKKSGYQIQARRLCNAVETIKECLKFEANYAADVLLCN